MTDHPEREPEPGFEPQPRPVSRPVPRVDRPGVGLVLVAEWVLPTPARGCEAADAAVDAWRRMPWPRGLIAHACLLGTDEPTVLHYTQWTGEGPCRAFTRTGRPRWARAVDAAAPGIECRDVTGYRLHRSRHDDVAAWPPGCVVAVSREFDGPDLARARAWTDAIFAVPSGATPLPGLISAHFHVGTDGTRVLNYAEWTSEEAHRAVTAGAEERIEADPDMSRVESWPGLVRTTVRRFRPYRGLGRPAG